MNDGVKQIEDRSEALKLLGQAYEILNKKSSWKGEDREIMQMLEKILLLRNKQNDIQKAFDSFGETTASIVEMDFSKRAVLPAAFADEADIFNYFSQSLNFISEELEQQAISKSIADAIITKLSDSASILVCNPKGLVSFVNKKAEEVFGLQKEQWLNSPVQNLFKDFKAIQHQLERDGEIKGMPVQLYEDAENFRLLNVSLIKNKSGKTEGISYILDEKKQAAGPTVLSKQFKETELESLVKEYRSLSKFWLEQGTSLTSEEVFAIDQHLNKNSNKASGKKLSKSDQLIQKTYNMALQKLNQSIHQYDNWVIKKAIDLKAKDTKGEFSQYPKLPKDINYSKPEKKINELLREYDFLWKTWVDKHVLLSAKEELAIDYFLNFRSHEVLATQLKLPEAGIRFTYENAVRKLRFSLQRYHSWIIMRALELSRVVKDENKEALNRFLKTPLSDSDLPVPVIQLLESADYKTPEDLITKASIRSLSKLRGLGAAKLKTILNLFKKNHSDHLLKKA